MWGRGVLPTALPTPLSATLSPALSVYLLECGAAGSASARTACAVCPTLRQSRSATATRVLSTLVPVSVPPTGLDECLFFIYLVSDPLPFDSPSVLVVRGGAVRPPTPPSWFSNINSLFFMSLHSKFLFCAQNKYSAKKII